VNWNILAEGAGQVSRFCPSGAIGLPSQQPHRHPESLTGKAASIFRLFLTAWKMVRFFVMAGLVPAIHVFLA
jgi:hypothetical protein